MTIKTINWIKPGLLLLSLLVLGGCINSGRYSMKNDKAPLRPPTSLEMTSVTPRYQPLYPPSVRPYTVLGKRYTPLKTAKNYLDEGPASWYGRKFHGHQTANGEIYDMYAMSAAHKTLPLPSFVKVTNLANQRSVVVKVNDRGPFHGNRLIDLSYSAAYALDMLRSGTARVRLEAIVVDAGKALAAAKPVSGADSLAVDEKSDSKGRIYIQVMAGSDRQKISESANDLALLLQQPVITPNSNGIYRLRLGPLKNRQHARTLINTLKNNGYLNAYMLYSSP